MKYIISTLVAVVGFMCWPHFVSAATLYPYSSVETVSLNGTVSVELRLDSDGEVVNAVEAALSYDSTVLQVLDISRGQSFLQLWTEAPHVESPGRVMLSGGRPDGSVVSGGNIATVTFRTLRLGSTTIAVQPAISGVYISDGRGTPAKVTARSLKLNVVSSSQLVTQPFSPSHPNESAWSSTRTFSVRWTPYKDVVISYILSRSPTAVPDDIVEENSGLATFPNLQDGIWYFSFAERWPGSPWSQVVRREVRIDGTAPEVTPPTLLSELLGRTIMSFTSNDLTSGVASETVDIVRWMPWRPWVTTIERRSIEPGLELHDVRHVASLTFRAIDNAGNVRTERLNVSGVVSLRTLIFGAIGAMIALCTILLFLVHSRVTKRRRR